MSYRKKVFAFDIDGTITHENKPLSKEVIALFNEIVLKGNILTFASSRSIRGMSNMIPTRFLNAFVIYCNGAFSTLNHNIICGNAIKPDVIDIILSFFHENKNHFYLESGVNYYYPDAQSHRFYDILRREAPDEYIGTINKIRKMNVYKIALLDRVTPDFIDLVNRYTEKIKIYIHEDGTADIVNNSCSKWKALESYYNKVLYNIYAFGNDLNDLEMITNADFSVAVSPNCESVINAADIVIHDKNAESLVNTVKQLL